MPVSRSLWNEADTEVHAMPSRVLAVLFLLVGFLPACDDECTICPAPAGGIQGRVLDPIGNPVGGIQVVIGEKRPTTGPNGDFHFDAVLPPYDLVVLDTPVLVYRGLAHSDPTVTTRRAVTTLRFSTVTGRVPYDPGVSTAVFFAGGLGVPTWARPPSSSYLMRILWRPDLVPPTGTLHALQRQEVSGPTKEYLGLASRRRTLEQDEVVEDFAPTAFEDVPTASVHATVTLPAAYEPQWNRLTLLFEGQRVQLEQRVEKSSEFDFAAPVLGKSPCRISVGAQDASLFRSSQGAAEFLPGLEASLEIVVYAGPEPSSPADGATGVVQSTPFAWSPGGGPGIYVMSVSSSSSASALLVFTADT